jgi:protein-L-isoaspartate(D-aspartate) O-methyltransferase
MVDRLAAQGIRDRRVLEAMGTIPRHLFVRDSLRERAYSDRALPLAEAQSISQPWVVARMTELLAPEKTHTVLEIGTGSGYQTAILAMLARRVYSLEILSDLARQAARRLAGLGLDNVKVQAFDGSRGWSEAAPYDRILVTAGAPAAPEPLRMQLVEGGRLVLPEGDQDAQRIVVYRKLRGGGFRHRIDESVRFVPLRGRHGWGGA